MSQAGKPSPDKMYVVVRSDLTAGSQAVQACHAALAFVEEHGVKHGSWTASSGYLVLLQASDESSLGEIEKKAVRSGIKFSGFREPDLNLSLTALALEPGSQSRRLCSSLRLAMAEDGASGGIPVGGG